jgi:hypothetical protein
MKFPLMLSTVDFRLRDARVSNDSACSSVSREPEKRGTGSRRGVPGGVQGHSRRSLHLSRGEREGRKPAADASQTALAA